MYVLVPRNPPPGTPSLPPDPRPSWGPKSLGWMLGSLHLSAPGGERAVFKLYQPIYMDKQKFRATWWCIVRLDSMQGGPADCFFQCLQHQKFLSGHEAPAKMQRGVCPSCQQVSLHTFGTFACILWEQDCWDNPPPHTAPYAYDHMPVSQGYI